MKQNIEKEKERLMNKKFTIKEMLSYFYVSYKKCKNKMNIADILATLTVELMDTEETEIVELVDKTTFNNVDLQWTLFTNEVYAYAFVMFDSCIMYKQEMNLEKLGEIFLDVARVYSPSNAIEYMQTKLKEDTNYNNSLNDIDY